MSLKPEQSIWNPPKGQNGKHPYTFAAFLWHAAASIRKTCEPNCECLEKRQKYWKCRTSNCWECSDCNDYRICELYGHDQKMTAGQLSIVAPSEQGALSEAPNAGNVSLVFLDV